MDRYAVIGNPVAQSRSPEIHAAFAAQCGHAIEYTCVLAPLGGFTAVVRQFRDAGGRGVNVTVPFKEEAFRFADESSERARTAGAANCLRFDDKGTYADNTDGVGLVRDIRDNLGVALHRARVLLVGAGGAARGAIGPLLDERPAALSIVNRTAARAQALAGEFIGLTAVSFDALAGQRFDVVINATAASLAGEALPLGNLYAPGALAYDMMYGREATPFMKAAAAHGARTADGLGMLVEQAAESFLLWRGARPATRPVIEALRRGL